MADCEQPPAALGARVAPAVHPPPVAWLETESPETRRLLAAPPPASWCAGRLDCERGPKTPKIPPPDEFRKRKETALAAFRPPRFVLSLVVVIVCVHLWASERVRATLEWAPGPWWREPWRLLTYGCVHANGAHLALNAVVALAVGWRLELEQGWARVAGLWCGGVAAGAIGAGLLQPHVRVVGASAGVYALLTAHLPNVCLRFGHIPLWWFRPLSVVVLSATEAWWALAGSPPPPMPGALPALAPPPAYANVAWAAHVFGAALSVPLAFILFTGENSSKRYILVFRVVSAVLLAATAVVTAVYYVRWYDPDYT